MISRISILKIFLILILTLPVSFLVSELIIFGLSVQQIWYIYILQFASTLIFLELGLWIFHEKSILKSIFPKFALKKYVLGSFAGFAFIVLSQLYSILFDQKLFFINNIGYILIFGLVFVFQSFVEEVVFRKFLIDEFKSLFKGKYILSSVVAALMFSVAHLLSNNIWIDIFNLFLFGCFLGLVYTYIESRFPNEAIWWTSGFHFAWNFTYFLLGIQFPSQSDPEQTLASYGPMHIIGNQTSFWIAKIAISVIFSFGIWWILTRKQVFKKY